ncbi:MAG: HAD family hydrolase [Actinomycetota bacterium]
MTDRWATFDCYGTLIDWERGIADTFARLWPDTGPADLLRTYHVVEPRVQAGSDAPYRDVLTESLAHVAAENDLPLAGDDTDALVRSLPTWPPFPEVPSSLSDLRERGWHIAVLSNTDPELLDASIGNIGVPVDLRITVAEAGSYKPAPRHWERFFADSGADRARHVHVGASIFHDIEPALSLGVPSVWINRTNERSDVARSAELISLAGLPGVLDGLVPVVA